MSDLQPDRPWETPASPQRKSGGNSRATWIVVGILAIGGCAYSIAANEGGGSSGGPASAQMACEYKVRAQLKAPSTAKFRDVRANEGVDGKWVVSGYVDAENSFGGTVRNHFSCNLQHVHSDEYSGTATIY